jgi:hypothetical protein
VHRVRSWLVFVTHDTENVMQNESCYTPLRFRSSLLIVAQLLFAACSSAPDEVPERGVSRVVTSELSSSLPPSHALLSYLGGPVISNVEVVEVLYGGARSDYFSQVFDTTTPSIASFYAAVADSPYFDWLTEYDTTGTFSDGVIGTQQTIGRGRFRGRFVIAPSPTNDGALITDAAIQSEIAAQIDAGTLPAPTTDAQGIVNTIYMVHFPIGKQIAGPGIGLSCEKFCAYHGTFRHGDQHLYYGVLPDISRGSGCDVDCGASGQFENQTAIASHELVEAVTDPEIGLASSIAAPLAWVDAAHDAEIGDLCSRLQGTTKGADGVTYVVQEQFSNLANDCVVTACRGGTLTPAGNLAVFSFVPGEIFVVDGNTLIKIAGTGGSGASNMFDTGRQGSSLVCNVGQTPVLLGDQEFSAAITSVKFISGTTMVALANGKVLKVDGTGGRGHNMFAVRETSDGCGFATLPSFHYYVGSHQFASPIIDITAVGSQTFLSLESGDMLKIDGAGGGGCNMFAVQQVACGFASLPGFHYLVGSQVFDRPVATVRGVGTETFIGLDNGAMLKIRGTGGSGCNMFAAQKTACGFATLPGYDHVIGSQAFDAPVVDVTQIGSQMLVSLQSGDVLKINGTGGGGCNMFAVENSSCGFTGLPAFNYLAGSEHFDDAITAVRQIGTQLFFGLRNGKLLKLSGPGGGGCNMFAIQPGGCGYENLPGFHALLGSQQLSSAITDVTQVATPTGSQTFVAASAGQLWRLNGSGGVGCAVINGSASTQD